MTLRARVFCFSLLVASRGRYIARFIPPDRVSTSQIERMKWRVMWRGKTRGKVAKQFCDQSIDNDGLGILDPNLSYQAELLMWIAKFESNPNGTWQNLLLQLLQSARLRGSQTDWVDPFTQALPLSNIRLPSPWPGILKLWRKHNGGLRAPRSFEEALEQPIFVRNNS